MKNLTNRQKEVLEFIARFTDENGNTVWEYVVTSQYEKKNKEDK